jgi:hypothetical protein
MSCVANPDPFESVGDISPDSDLKLPSRGNRYRSDKGITGTVEYLLHFINFLELLSTKYGLRLYNNTTLALKPSISRKYPIRIYIKLVALQHLCEKKIWLINGTLFSFFVKYMCLHPLLRYSVVSPKGKFCIKGRTVRY